MVPGPVNDFRGTRRHQRGAALMLVLVLVSLLIAMFAVIFVNDLVRQNLKQKETSAALARAKEALIGYAASVDLGAGFRPGDLPCPDIVNDGVAGGSCSNGGGTTLGRLPWRTLGLPDLRDGDGERLWYAVSTNFKNNPRTTCTSPEQAGCLNSSTRGTISLRDRNGSLTYDGSSASGVIAVVIAPGTALQRTDSASTQDRGTAGVNTAINYLDIGGGEDNANFTDSSSSNGVINGPIYDANDRQIVNDTVLPITYSDLIPLLQRRVAQETMNCLSAYAAASFGRYPWAARIDDSATSNDYSSKQYYRFGRVPTGAGALTQNLLGILPAGDPLLVPIPIVAPSGIVPTVCGLTPALCVSTSWPGISATPPSCSIPATGDQWWMNWKDSVFYAFATNNQPTTPTTTAGIGFLSGLPSWLLSFFFSAPTTAPACGSPGNCMTVDPPSATAGRKIVVVVAGQPLAPVAGGQPRATTTDRSTIANYLEDDNALVVGNAVSNFSFDQKPVSSTFNDFLLYQ